MPIMALFLEADRTEQYNHVRSSIVMKSILRKLSSDYPQHQTTLGCGVLKPAEKFLNLHLLLKDIDDTLIGKG